MTVALRGSRWLREDSDCDVVFIRDLADDLFPGLMITIHGEFPVEAVTVDDTNHKVRSIVKIPRVWLREPGDGSSLVPQFSFRTTKYGLHEFVWDGDRQLSEKVSCRVPSGNSGNGKSWEWILAMDLSLLTSASCPIWQPADIWDQLTQKPPIHWVRALEVR